MLVKEKTPSVYKIHPSNFVLEDIDRALEIALFYGFIPIKSPEVSKEDSITSKDFGSGFSIHGQKTDSRIERHHKIDNKISLLRTYMEGGFRSFQFPLMVCHREDEKKTDNNNKESFLNLSILGASGGIAEAIAIKTSLTILNEKQRSTLNIEINSIGDKESFSRFEKELVSYFKKNGNQNITKDPGEDFYKELVNLTRTSDEKEKKEDAHLNFVSNIPKPLNYLTQPSIRHLKEVLESLENLKISYDLNHMLIPNRQFCHHTAFQIKDGKDVVALGLRHQSLAKKLRTRREIPIVTVVVKDDLSGSRTIKIKSLKPKFFLVQFGNRAKIKSLEVIECLRGAGIPVYHSLIEDRLTGQMERAEKLKFSHILIIGEKEALEDSVAIRNMETRVQKIVPMSELAKCLRSIKA